MSLTGMHMHGGRLIGFETPMINREINEMLPCLSSTSLIGEPDASRIDV